METAQTDLEARIEALEEEITTKREELLKLRRTYTHPVENYEFESDGGRTAHLSELFGSKDDLILVHNMGSRCAYCTLWADGFNGVYGHLADRAAFALISPDSPEQQRAFAGSRGWNFPLYSDRQRKFSTDMGFLEERDGARYSLPGVSTFHRAADGTITRIAKEFFGPGDNYCSVWHLFDLLAEGGNEWHPRLSYQEQ